MPVMTTRDLYDLDFFEWTRCNAALLRAGQLDQADLEHIAEEIEDMGKSQRCALARLGTAPILRRDHQGAGVQLLMAPCLASQVTL